MPRTKETRNPMGSIFKRKVTRRGKKIDVWDVRKRQPKLDAGGEILRNEQGAIIYQDKTQRCYSYADAIAALAAAQAGVQEGNSGRGNNRANEKTFFELIEYFSAEYVKPAVFSRGDGSGVKIEGYRKNLTHIKTLLEKYKKYFGDVALSKITPAKILRFKNHLQSKKTSRGQLPAAGTVNEQLAFLKRVFSVGAEEKWIRANPFALEKGIIQKSESPARKRILTPDEERRLLAECVDEVRPQTYLRDGKKIKAKIRIARAHLRPVVLLALDAGLQKPEIQNLLWRQIDFENRTIQVDKQTAAKNLSAENISLTPRLSGDLQAVKAKAENSRKDDPVIGKVDFKKAFASASFDARIKNLQFKDLRATFEARRASAGESGESKTGEIRKAARSKDKKAA